MSDENAAPAPEHGVTYLSKRVGGALPEMKPGSVQQVDSTSDARVVPRRRDHGADQAGGS
jgi:hypothetical protein